MKNNKSMQTYKMFEIKIKTKNKEEKGSRISEVLLNLKKRCQIHGWLRLMFVCFYLGGLSNDKKRVKMQKTCSLTPQRLDLRYL